MMGRKPLILVVDDSEGYRELLGWILERHGFQMISAECGPDGVELAIERQPALVLMDLNMSGMDGYEATRAIHAHRHGRKIPVVAVSADCTAYGFERWALNAGFIAFLAKPFEPEALLKVVTKALKNGVERRRAA
jgi:CheY-like chemotaxis protein